MMTTGSAGTAVRLAAVGTAVPAYTIDQQAAFGRLAGRYRGVLNPHVARAMEKIFAHPSIRQRHFAVEDPDRVFGEDPDCRIERFREQAVALGCRAGREALERAGCAPRDVRALVVNTCTGYLCPGLSSYLVEALALRRDMPAFDLVGAGCGGAVPNLVLGRSLLAGYDDGVVLNVAVEICSATFQMDNDIGLIVSNALFGDGAAAAVLWKRPAGLRLAGSASRHIPEYRDDIRFVYRNGQLRNRLTTRLPELAGRAVGELADGLLADHHLARGQVRHWALHSGGENVINAVKAALGLSEEQLAPTRAVLAAHGNMSSPTALFVLRQMLDGGIAPGERCLMAAFGAGFSAHALLFEMGT
jgi:predicted naringenin-chalcone synthase